VSARSEADTHGTGIHLGAALKLPILPLLPLLPLGVYVVAGGGLYHHAAAPTSTDLGLSAGAGTRLGLGLSVLAEGRS